MVSLANRMKLVLLLLTMCAIQTSTKRTRTPKPEGGTSATTNGSSSVVPATRNIAQKAIIAIEVVNSNDNSTNRSKGHKRTIESALGYGYSNNIGGYDNFFNVKPKPPKYEVYKYSQHDIPAYKGHSKGHFTSYESGFQVEHPHGAQSEVTHQNYQAEPETDNFEVQKSIEYNLGSTPPAYQPQKNLQQFYQNGATLFSSLDQKGHLSSLSVQAPRQHGPRVPVLIFRVYTNQLAQAGGLHPNIPSSHPYSNLNNVDLQGLLAGYVKQQQQPHQIQELPRYQAPQYLPQSDTYYMQHPVVGHQQYGPPKGHFGGLDTNENYPDDAHTKVIFHKNKASERRPKPHQGYHQHANQAHSYYKRPTPQKFKISIPENTFSKVEVQEHTYNPSATGAYTRYEPNQYDLPPLYDANQQYYQTPGGHQDYQQSVQYQQVQQSPSSVIQQSEEQPVHYDAKEYVQVAYDQNEQHEQHQQEQQSQQVLGQEYYPQNTAYHQQEGEQQQQQQEYQQYYSSSTQEIEYLHRNPEQARDNPDYALVKESNDAGRDLHPKVYNYHAHGGPKRKRERKSKVPLVVAASEESKSLKINQ